MSNPRAEAFEALRAAEQAAQFIPDALTVGAIDQIKNTLQAMAAAQRRAVEWIDAIEI